MSKKTTRLQLSLRAEKLKGGALSSLVPAIAAPDPYAVVRLEEDGTVLGETEVIQHSLDPRWSKIIFLNYEADATMYVTVSVFHRRRRGGGGGGGGQGDDDGDDRREDKLLGSASFDVGTVFNHAENKLLVRELDTDGRLYAHVDVSRKGNCTRGETIQFRLRGLELENVEDGVLALGRSDPFYEISKREGNPDENGGRIWWNVVYRSEHVNNNLNPYWETVTLDLETLCNADLDWPIEVTVYDWQKSGRHRAIGSFRTTVQGFVKNKCKRGNGDRSTAYVLLDEDGKSRGLITVVEAVIK